MQLKFVTQDNSLTERMNSFAMLIKNFMLLFKLQIR